MSKHKEQAKEKLRPARVARVPGDPLPVRHGGSAERNAAPFQSPLARVLETAHLAALVPYFPAETLHALIRHGGLHDTAELLVAATPEQLTAVFDLDLWRHAQPGQNEQFDADRFGEWLEVLIEVSPAVAARIVAAQDEHLVIAGVSRYVRVLDPATIAPPTWSDDQAPSDAESAPREGSESAIGGYLVSAVRADAWDAVVGLLMALEADHPRYFQAVMRGCRLLSNSTPEVDGLDNLLTAPEQLLHDVSVGREHRQSLRGYSTPADARAFLQMARQRRREARDGTSAVNPIAAAYFRAVDDVASTAEHAARDAPGNAGATPAPPGHPRPEGLDAMVDLLAEAGLVPGRPRALLEGSPSEQSRLARLRPLMEYVRDNEDDAYFARSRELAFLANTLMAGCSVQSRAFTAQEASDAVVSTCNLGLEQWPARWPDSDTRPVVASAPAGSLPEDFLVRHDLVTAFEVGWAVLYEDVSLTVASRLLITLKGVRSGDAEIQRGLAALRRELVAQQKARTPWRARGALEVIALLDMTAWASLVGLLDECPVLPEALTATLKGHTRGVSATAFEFISTTAQIEAVKAFMERLGRALGP
jgi:hypothetical protein